MISLRKPTILFQAILVLMLTQLALDIYLPSIPAMTIAMNTSAFTLKVSMTLMITALGLSQLYFGPLSDFHGRKSVILRGLAIFTIGSAITLIPNSVICLLLGRMIQGIGLGFGLSLASVVASDLYDGKKCYQAMSIISAIYALMPVLAPVIGGYLQHYISWKASFWLLTILGAGLLTSIFYFFPETHIVEKTTKSPWPNILDSYKTCLSNPLFLVNVSIAALFYSGEVAYIIQLPLIAQWDFSIPVQVVGYLVLFTSSAIILGSLLSSYLLKYLSSNTIIVIGNICALLASLLLFFLIYFYHYHLYSLIIPMMLFMFGSGLSFPNSIANCLKMFSGMSGVASSLAMGTLTMFGGAMTYFIAKIPVGKIYGLPLFLLIVSIGLTLSIIAIALCSPKRRL